MGKTLINAVEANAERAAGLVQEFIKSVNMVFGWILQKDRKRGRIETEKRNEGRKK